MARPLTNICVFLGVLGAALIATGNPALVLWANLAWVLANAGLFARNLSIEENPQAIMFAVYLLLAVIGVFKWL